MLSHLPPPFLSFSLASGQIKDRTTRSMAGNEWDVVLEEGHAACAVASFRFWCSSKPCLHRKLSLRRALPCMMVTMVILVLIMLRATPASILDGDTSCIYTYPPRALVEKGEISFPKNPKKASCADWFEWACYDPVNKAIITNSSLVGRRNYTRPGSRGEYATIHFGDMGALADSFKVDLWYDGLMVMDSWRTGTADGGYDMRHIGVFLTQVGALFDYDNLRRSCSDVAPDKGTCNAVLAMNPLNAGSDRKEWEMGDWWGKSMLPVALRAASRGLCASSPDPFTHVLEPEEPICARNVLVDYAFTDVYPTSEGVKAWRAETRLHMGYPAEGELTSDVSEPAKVLVVDRGKSRPIINIGEVVAACETVFGKEHVTLINLEESGFATWTFVRQLALFADHQVVVSREGSHIANFIGMPTNCSVWIEIRNAGVGAGVTQFAGVLDFNHLTYINDDADLLVPPKHESMLEVLTRASKRVDGQTFWNPEKIDNPKYRCICDKEKETFHLGDRRPKQPGTGGWPCFWSWGLIVKIPKFEALLRTAEALAGAHNQRW